ncbi:hypothetical protein [Listeria booriae]|nr:hypothetical protein [Listeria booriae]
MVTQLQIVTGAADGMTGLITTGLNVITWLQRGSLVGAALAFCWGGYLLMLGGGQGRRSCVGVFLGAAVGLVVVMGCHELATGVDNSVKF